MLTIPDSRKTGKIFKKCQLCKAEKYLPINQRFCDRCLKEEQLKLPTNTRHIDPPKDKPKQVRKIKAREIVKKGKIHKKFWVI